MTVSHLPAALLIKAIEAHLDLVYGRGWDLEAAS